LWGAIKRMIKRYCDKCNIQIPSEKFREFILIDHEKKINLKAELCKVCFNYVKKYIQK
jgi:hypothetical protein